MKSSNHKLFVFMFLLAFIGQVTASTIINCSIDDSHQMVMMDHDGHSMEMQTEMPTNVMAEDCCNSVNECSMSGCLSIVLIDIPNLDEISLTSESVIMPKNLASNHPASFHFRPPILG